MTTHTATLFIFCVPGNSPLALPTSALRVTEHSRRALRFAQGLAGLGARVVYPGLPDHPQHALLVSMANAGYGGGGMLTLEMPTLAAAKALMERLQNVHGFGLMAVSLGGADTLMSASASTTASELRLLKRRGRTAASVVS